MNLAVCQFGTGFCLPKFINIPFEINVSSALWLTISHQSFQESVEFGGRKETLFDKYFDNSEM